MLPPLFLFDRSGTASVKDSVPKKKLIISGNQGHRRILFQEEATHLRETAAEPCFEKPYHFLPQPLLFLRPFQGD